MRRSFNLVVYGVDLRIREIHLVGKRGLERVEEIGGRFGGEYLFRELGILKPYRNVEIEIYVGACLGERVYLFRLLGDIALQGFSVCGGNTAEKLKAVFVVAVRVNAVKSVKIVACDVGGIVAEIHVLARVLGFCRIISRGVSGCVRFCGRRNAAGVCGKHDFVAPASETVGNGSVQRIRKPGDKRGYRNISGDVVCLYTSFTTRFPSSTPLKIRA